jgi:ribose transport system ATP-binding protein
VYQELSLIPDMTVAQNIWLTHEPLSMGGRVREREVRARTEALLNLFAGTTRSSLHADATVATLPPDEKQIVEILKALSYEPRLLILDEATASLDSRQVSRLFELVRQWQARGMAIVFVSHRMEEVFGIATRVTILRNGKHVVAMPIGEINERALVELMIDRSVASRQTERVAEDRKKAVRMQARELHSDVLRNVSLDLHDGELLGLGGLQGQGQSDVLLALFGAVPFRGAVMMGGEGVRWTHPRHAIRSGVAFVPGDRNTEGLLPVRSILENLQLPSWRGYGAILKLGKANADALAMAQRLNLKMDSLNAPVSSLSGGNAQKVVLGKWLLRQPKVLLLNDPTKGVDVGAKGDFYRMLTELRAADMAILLYSSDDEELVGLCDRVLVMRDGVITAELAGQQLTKSELLAASVGTAHGEAV